MLLFLLLALVEVVVERLFEHVALLLQAVGEENVEDNEDDN